MGAIKSPEWPKWKEAIEKEIIGLLMMDLWKEVPRDSVPEGQRVNSNLQSRPSRFIYLRAEKRTLAAGAALDGDMEYRLKRVMVTK